MFEPLEGRVRVESGLLVGRRPERELLADVYLPPTEGAGRPAVLLVHGGGWYEGDRRQLQGYAVQLARRGLVVIACEYRLSGEAVWPAPLEDVELAFEWSCNRAADFGADASRIALFGVSAGAHLALLVAAARTGRSPSPAAVVGFYPPVRLALGAPDGAVAALMGGTADGAKLREASPIERVSPGFPPTQLLHGNADDLVPCEGSFELYRRLRELRSRAELHVFDGADHAFDAQPGFGRPCLQLVLLFLQRILGAGGE